MTIALAVAGFVTAVNIAVVLAGLRIAARRPRPVVPPAHPRRRADQRRAA